MDRFEAGRRNDGYGRAAEPAADDIKKVLIVSQDPATLDQLAAALNQQFDVQLTCVTGDKLALDPNMAVSHDLLVLDVDGIAFSSSVLSAACDAGPAMICICSERTLPDLVQYTRGTTREILLKPIKSEELLEVSQKALRGKEQALGLAIKYRKMRQLVRRVVRERRDLNRRVELVCRDLVEAHRRLTHRFVELQKTQTNHS